MLPCLSVGGGVKLNYPLVPRLPGDVCRGAGALALPPVVGGCIGICARTRVYVHSNAYTYIYTYARATYSAEAFSIKINTGGWPRPRTPPYPPARSSPPSTRTVLISPPNRRTCSAMHPPSRLPDSFDHLFLRDASLLSYVHCVINSV